MKKLLLILILGFLCCKQGISQGKNIVISQPRNNASLSNNPGTIINNGLIVSDGSRIYYAGINSKQGLYSKKLNGTDVKKLSNGYVEYLNTINGWLYYRVLESGKNANNGGLYKMRTDGTKKQCLTSDEPFYINVIDNYIYYINWSYSTDICRIKTDGTGRQILYTGHFDCLTTDGNYLYFGKMAGAGTSLLYRGSVSGNQLKQMLTDTIDKFFVYKDWIYYRKDYSKICRLNKETLQTNILISDPNLDADFIIPDGDDLYLGGLDGVQKYNISEKKFKTLYNVRIIELGLAANYIYYTTAIWDKNNERHTKTHLITLSDLAALKYPTK